MIQLTGISLVSVAGVLLIMIVVVAGLACVVHLLKKINNKHFSEFQACLQLLCREIRLVTFLTFITSVFGCINNNKFFAYPVLTPHYCRIMKAMKLQIQPPTQGGSSSSPLIPPLLAEFAKAVDAANASESKKMTVSVNVETHTQDDHVNDQDDIVNDQDDSVNDQDGENGKFLQLIY